MQYNIKIIYALALLVFQSGCSSLNDFDFPGVYKLDIQQGNIIEQDKVERLQLGLTRDQVKYVMGSPPIVDTFDNSHWDYVYQLIQSDGTTTYKHIRIVFENDFVTAIE